LRDRWGRYRQVMRAGASKLTNSGLAPHEYPVLDLRIGRSLFRIDRYSVPAGLYLPASGCAGWARWVVQSPTRFGLRTLPAGSSWPGQASHEPSTDPAPSANAASAYGGVSQSRRRPIHPVQQYLVWRSNGTGGPPRCGRRDGVAGQFHDQCVPPLQGPGRRVRAGSVPAA